MFTRSKSRQAASAAASAAASPTLAAAEPVPVEKQVKQPSSAKEAAASKAIAKKSAHQESPDNISANKKPAAKKPPAKKPPAKKSPPPKKSPEVKKSPSTKGTSSASNQSSERNSPAANVSSSDASSPNDSFLTSSPHGARSSSLSSAISNLESPFATADAHDDLVEKSTEPADGSPSPVSSSLGDPTTIDTDSLRNSTPSRKRSRDVSEVNEAGDVWYDVPSIPQVANAYLADREDKKTKHTPRMDEEDKLCACRGEFDPDDPHYHALQASENATFERLEPLTPRSKVRQLLGEWISDHREGERKNEPQQSELLEYHVLAAEASRDTTPGSFASNTPTKRGVRSGPRGGRGRGRGRGGRGGRGGRQGGAGEPSNMDPKPPPPTDAEKKQIALLKARQAELKKWCKAVGPQQLELLNALSDGDLLTVKNKRHAHEKVSEHMHVIDDLLAHKEDAERYANLRYEYDMQQAEFVYNSGKAVIEQQFKVSDPFHVQ